MTPLTPLPVTRASMEPGQLYIWHPDTTRYQVVRLSAHGDSLVTLHDSEEWFFAHGLIGSLYGPISLAP